MKINGVCFHFFLCLVSSSRFTSELLLATRAAIESRERDMCGMFEGGSARSSKQDLFLILFVQAVCMLLRIGSHASANHMSQWGVLHRFASSWVLCQFVCFCEG